MRLILITSIIRVRRLFVAELAAYLYKKLNVFGQAKGDYKCIIINFSF